MAQRNYLWPLGFIRLQQGLKYRTAGRRSWWPAKYFLPRQTPIFAGQINEYYNFFLPMEYQITLEIDRCTALTFRFFAASWWKIHSQVVEFLPAIFARFDVRLYILWVSSYDRVLSLQGSSWICIYRWNLILFVFESLLHKEETSLNISGKEVDLGRNLFHKQRICHQKSINIQRSFRLGRHATLSRNSDKAEKEDFKRRDRRLSFLINLVFIRQFWNRVRKRDSCST